ncbi:MAG: DNA repair protein RadA [Phycisphaerales bacterium]|nr:DNA repair protein RadA [Phycisphaerales bacterium]
MSKIRTIYICTSCGSTHNSWMGKCSDCGSWDSLEESQFDKSAAVDPHRGSSWVETKGGTDTPTATSITEIMSSSSPLRRLPTGITEFDRVLGGTDADECRGLVPGSVVLVGGEPGIGKSTLLLQAAGAWASPINMDAMNTQQADWTSKVLYVSSEESAQQIQLRADRLGVADADGLFVLADTNLARIIEQIRKIKPDVCVIDSIQMIYKADLEAAPGSVTQLRRCCSELVYFAKATGVSIVLVGHVTKEGTLAGPRMLEHMVDAVLYFEGDRYHSARIVRAIKNRFGTTLELGIFEMTGQGLQQLPGGMSVAAIQGGSEHRPGAIVCPAMHGSRCVCVEIQALTATGFVGSAKRKSSGLDSSRLAMLIAVLEQHGGLRLADRDVFTSVVGGLKIVEPAADLAIALAIAGAHYKRSLPPTTIAIGEVGLGGELRSATQLEQRLRESARLGYTHAIVPAAGSTKLAKIKGMELIPVKNLSQAIERLM